jgi:acetyl esterase/lipase
VKYAQAKPLNRAMMKWFGKWALPNPAFARNPLASPLKYADVRGLPPATVVLAEIDPLLSQAQGYAVKLQKAGVPVRWRLFKGVTHEFFGMGAVVPAAKEAVNFAASELKKAYAR